MAVPQQRDPELTRTRLAEWCSRHLADGAPVRVAAPRVPDAVGFANETVLFDLAWADRRERLVARIATPTYQVYPDTRLHEQYRLLDILGTRTDVPVPRAFGFEPDPDLLGGPFLVMGFVPGRVPADFPSYHRQGWVADLSDTERGTLWRAGLAAMSRVHHVDPMALGLGFVGRWGPDWSWLDGQIDHYTDHLDFFRCADEPVVLLAVEWLRAHRPARPTEPGLLWGDARIGNIVFANLRAAAVLDWEMAALGPAEADLAWYLYLDRHLGEGIGADRLPGLPGRAATISWYARLLGRELDDLTYYDVFAGFRFALVAARVSALATTHGMVPAGVDFPLHRNAIRLLERTVREADTAVGLRRADRSA
jgi:aminoglycoside phosphotransferase (APT) family kinase protein